MVWRTSHHIHRGQQLCKHLMRTMTTRHWLSAVAIGRARVLVLARGLVPGTAELALFLCMIWKHGVCRDFYFSCMQCKANFSSSSLLPSQFLPAPVCPVGLGKPSRGRPACRSGVLCAEEEHNQNEMRDSFSKLSLPLLVLNMAMHTATSMAQRRVLALSFGGLAPPSTNAALYRCIGSRTIRAASTSNAAHPLSRRPQLGNKGNNSSSGSRGRQQWSTATALMLATLTGAAVGMIPEVLAPTTSCILTLLRHFISSRLIS